MRMVWCCLIVYLLIVLCSTAFGWTQEWTNTTGNGQWSTPGNWLTGQVPVWNDGWVGIDTGSPGPTIDATIYDPQFGTNGESWIQGVVIGDSGTGTGYMRMTGGTLKTGFPGDGTGGGAFGGVVLGYGDGTNPNCHGVLNMEGGLLISYWDFIVSGQGGGNGTVNMTGGEIHIHRLFLGWGGGTGTINLDGGLILLPVEAGWGGDSRNGIVLDINEGGRINITKGKLQLQGDRTIQVGEYIRTGKIEAYDGNGTVLVDFNNVNPGMTNVWACKGKPQNYCNPMDVKGADFMINKFGDTYYCYATASQSYPNSTNGKGCPIFSSKDLVNWRYCGLTFDDSSNTWGQYWFWGPELYQNNGVYYLYSPCFRNINGSDVGRICVATSSSPIGPFTEIKAPMFDWDINQDVIDVGAFFDDDGSMYVYFTVTNYPLTIGGTGNVIYVAKVASDMETLATTPQLCIEPSQAWEEWINEGACVIKHNGIYYLTYSGDDFRRNYAVGYATSSSPYGPWTKYSGNPILSGTADINKPGSQCFIRSPDNTELFMAYHSMLGPPDIRQLNISRVHFEEVPGQPDRLVVDNGASKSPQPYPSGSHFTKSAVSDEFTGDGVNFDIWTNIWGQTQTQYDVNQGHLVLTLATGSAWQTNNDGSNVFLQLAPPGNWNITTRVTLDALQNFEAAFLTVWQDSDNYIILNSNYVNGKTFEAGVERNASYTSTIISNPIGNSTYLQLRRIGANIYQCYYSVDGIAWNKIGADISIDLQEIKVGLGAWLVYSSRTGVTATFDFFDVLRTSSAADINGDQHIDLCDLAMIASTWEDQNCKVRPLGDLNEDCSVDWLDIAILANEWLSN